MSTTETAVPVTTEAAPAPAATPVAAPDTAVETPAPAPEVQRPTTPIARDEARRHAREAGTRAREALQQPAEEPKPAAVPERDPATGQFLPKKTEEPAAAAAGTVVPDASPASARTTDASPEAPAAVRPIRIEIPAGHPLREMGRDAISVTDPADEQVIRAALNGTYERRQRVTALEQENAELRDRMLRLEATQSATTKWQSTPEYEAIVDEYERIRDEVSPEAADAYWQGKQPDFQKLAAAEYQTRAEAAEQVEDDRAAEAWATDAWGRTQVVTPDVRNLPEFPQWFAAAIESFNAEIAVGHFPELDPAREPDDYKRLEKAHEAFAQLFRSRLVREPRVSQVMTELAAQRNRTAAAEAARLAAEMRQSAEAEKERLRAQAEKDGVDRFKLDAATRRASAPPHPMGSVAAGARPGQASDGGPPADDTSDMTPHQLRRHFGARAREAARQVLGGVNRP